MKRKYSNAGLYLIVLCVGAIGCSALVDGKPAAESAIVEFHSMLDDERFGEIYAASDQAMKDETSQEDMLKLFTAVHTKLGSVKQSTNQTWRVQNYNLTNYVEMIQKTEFEKGGGTEKFTFMIRDKKAFLAGYYIESLDMMTN